MIRDMLLAKCIKVVNPIDDKSYDLEKGKEYPVSKVEMGSGFTFIFLKGKIYAYNSICFKFYEEGKEIDIYNDKKYNPYLK